MKRTFIEELQNLQNILNGLIVALVLVRCLIILSNARSNEQTFSAAAEQCKKVIKSGVICLFIPDYIKVLNSFVFFTNVSSVQNLKQEIAYLLQILTEVFTAFAAVQTSFRVLKEFIALRTAAEESKALHIQNIKKNLLIGIAVIGASGFLAVLFGYFA